MTGDSSSDLLTEYVTLLREFGLPPEDVRELHADGDAPADASLREFVARRVDRGSREALFAQLVETLTQSRRGISATASYWNYAPEVHLDEVFAPYGCSVTFRDAAHGGDGASVEIELEDAGGAGHRMRFEYPDTPLGDDNLPALLDAVERELLANSDLTFVLLSGIDRRWRVALIESDRLAALRRRHGDRIEFAGFPLLREDQPPAFASEETPAVYPRATDRGAAATDSEGTSIAERDAGDPPAGLLSEAAGTTPADAVGEPTTDPGDVLEASPDEIIADSAATPSGSSSSGVEASDRELKRVFGDLSDVPLEPTSTDETGRTLRPDDPPVLELGTGADAASRESGSDGGSKSGETATGDVEEPDAIDGLFEELERKAITGDDGSSGGGGGTAVVAGVASSGAPTAEVPDSDAQTRDDADEEPSVRELLVDADDATDADAVDSDDATDADAEDFDPATDVDAGDGPGEFEWLSEQELTERK